MNIWIYLLAVILALCMKKGEAIDSAFLLPSLCGTTEPRRSCKILKAHEGTERGDDVYSVRTPSCTYVMQAESPSHRLLFGVGTGNNEINVLMHEDGCDAARMRLLDSDGSTELAEFCDTLDRIREYISSGDSLTLEVLLPIGGNSSILNFTLHYTSFTEAANCSDDPDVFPCRNGRCIDPAGRCDVTLINNCGDFSDNSRGPPGNCSSETTTTTLATTTANSTAGTSNSSSSQTNLLWILWVVLGLLGAYFLYWSLWRPGYLIWRCSCWRNMACCRKCLAQGPPKDRNPFDCCGQSKIANNAASSSVANGPSANAGTGSNMASTNFNDVNSAGGLNGNATQSVGSTKNIYNSPPVEVGNGTAQGNANQTISNLPKDPDDFRRPQLFPIGGLRREGHIFSLS
ncbi:unnamed protein product [Clavelina lepadiformis]|uniref:CUB domain-containing protein n=1 Tax=Clavelina lepadiformis TaxID=159417 RepID=A0ABP0F8F8_CLALP